MDEIHQLVKQRIQKIQDLNEQIKNNETLEQQKQSNKQQDAIQNNNLINIENNQQKQNQNSTDQSIQQKFQEEIRKAKEEEKFRTEKENWILNILKQLKEYTLEQKQILFERSHDIMLLINPNFKSDQFTISDLNSKFIECFSVLYQRFFQPYEKNYVFKANLRYVSRSNNPTIVPDMLKYLVEFSRDSFKKFMLYQSQYYSNRKIQNNQNNSDKKQIQPQFKKLDTQPNQEIQNRQQIAKDRGNQRSKSILGPETQQKNKYSISNNTDIKNSTAQDSKQTFLQKVTNNINNNYNNNNELSSITEKISKKFIKNEQKKNNSNPINQDSVITSNTNTNNNNNRQFAGSPVGKKYSQQQNTQIRYQRQTSVNPQTINQQINQYQNTNSNSNIQIQQNDWYATVENQWFKKNEQKLNENKNNKQNSYNNVMYDLDGIHIQLSDFKLKRCRKYPDEMKINMNLMLENNRQRNNFVYNQSISKYRQNFLEKWGANIKELQVDKKGKVTALNIGEQEIQEQNLKLQKRKKLFNFYYNDQKYDRQKQQSDNKKIKDQKVFIIHAPKSSSQNKRKDNSVHKNYQDNYETFNNSINNNSLKKQNNLYNTHQQISNSNQNNNNNNNNGIQQIIQTNTYINSNNALSQQINNKNRQQYNNEFNLLTKTKIIKLTLQSCNTPFLEPDTIQNQTSPKKQTEQKNIDEINETQKNPNSENTSEKNTIENITKENLKNTDNLVQQENFSRRSSIILQNQKIKDDSTEQQGNTIILNKNNINQFKDNHKNQNNFQETNENKINNLNNFSNVSIAISPNKGINKSPSKIEINYKNDLIESQSFVNQKNNIQNPNHINGFNNNQKNNLEIKQEQINISKSLQLKEKEELETTNSSSKQPTNEGEQNNEQQRNQYSDQTNKQSYELKNKQSYYKNQKQYHQHSNSSTDMISQMDNKQHLYNRNNIDKDILTSYTVLQTEIINQKQNRYSNQRILTDSNINQDQSKLNYQSYKYDRKFKKLL